MEILRRLTLLKKRENSIDQPSKSVRQTLFEGRITTSFEGINSILRLQGNDETLLHLLVGQKLLNLKIDNSRRTKLGVSPLIGGIYGQQVDTLKTLRLRQRLAEVTEYIDLFIADKYGDTAAPLARNIQMAVNMLFAQTSYFDVNRGSCNQERTPETIIRWSLLWKDRINPQQ